MNLALCLTLGFIGFIIYIAWREFRTYLEHKRIIDEHFRRTNIFEASGKPEEGKPESDCKRSTEPAGSPANPEGKVSEESVRIRVGSSPGTDLPRVIRPSIHRGVEPLTPTTGPLASSPSNESEARGGVESRHAYVAPEPREIRECCVGRQPAGVAPGPLASLTPTPAVLQPREFRDAPRTEARPHQNAYPQGRWTRRG